MDTTISYELVKEMADNLQPGCPFSYGLRAGDTAWNPSSTKGPIEGSCIVTYRRHADGGWEAGVTAR